jgi:ubiquinone/menaquinone biosynthesis C-methylase UbiE
MFFRKLSARDPLAVTMSGVRMGERVLQVGADSPPIVGAIAAKVGLSGYAAIAVPDDQAADRARAGAADAGGLIDLHVTSLGALPFESGGFDAVVLHNTRGALTTLGPNAAAALGECRRVLREGGRMVVIEAGTPTGLAALIGGRAKAATDQDGRTLCALEAAGFKPVRLLADREGLRFVEGLKPTTSIR